MDMTAINIETINLIGKKILKNNRMKEITQKTMQGKIDFKESILIRTKMLEGINIDDIISLIPSINITRGINNVIKTMNQNGCHTMLISGGYNILADQIGKIIGFKEIRSNKLEIKNNLLTGEIQENVIDKKAKMELFKKSIIRENIDFRESLAIGDGDNDIDMLSHASLGVAYKAYPSVNKIADVLIRNEISSILYFQGYKDYEIVTA